MVHTGLVHDPLIAITFPVGSYLSGSLTSHLRYLGGDFFVAIFSASESTRVWDVS